MKLLPIILLLSVTSFAQDLRDQVKHLVGDRYQRETLTEAEQTARLMQEFLEDDEPGLDKAIKAIDMRQVGGLDVYLGQSEEAILEEIENDTEASFRSPKMKAISISQVSVIKNGLWEMVVIYSYR
jgi:hypothetical protein